MHHIIHHTPKNVSDPEISLNQDAIIKSMEGLQIQNNIALIKIEILFDIDNKYVSHEWYFESTHLKKIQTRVRIIKKGSSVILLLVTMLSVNDKNVNDNNIKNYLDSDCYAVANYIQNNFDLFVEKYNESSNEKLNASYVENSFYIKIVDYDGEQDGYFLDFNQDNGYVLIGNEYTFYDFSSNEKSPYENIESESYYYSTSRGYLYLKDGEYVNVDETKNMNNGCLDDLTFEAKTYAGQEDKETGCGYINDTDLYVNDKYGSGWTLSINKSLAMATGQYTDQARLSCYYDYSYVEDDLFYSSEGNCWFVSAYNVLQSLADATGNYKKKVEKYKEDSSKGSMPSIKEIVDYDAKSSEYDLYKKVYDDKGNNISGKITSKSGKTHYKTELRNTKFPKLYIDVRKYVVSKYKKVDGGTVYNTANIINEVGKQYGYDFKAKGTVAAGLYGNSGLTAINKGLPFVLCTTSASNAGYGNHLMAGCGYKVYSKTSGWWIFKVTSHKYFYELRDGHGEKERYFDLSAWTGFGGIVLLDYNLFY